MPNRHSPTVPVTGAARWIGETVAMNLATHGWAVAIHHDNSEEGGRRVMPQEIADAVRFILDAPSMTGQVIAVDGSQRLGWAQCARGPADEE